MESLKNNKNVAASDLSVSPDFCYWLVTRDSDPMPYECGWAFPFQIVHGTESFVVSYCASLNAKKGSALYEYSEITNQEILSQNDNSDCNSTTEEQP